MPQGQHFAVERVQVVEGLLQAAAAPLLKMLRNHPELLAIPVIIVTGLGIANVEWARSLGAAGLVRKPMDVEHLKDALARVFGTGTNLVRFKVQQPNEKPIL
ncbi:MAG TPA: hypothetical protein VG099_14695 [Gemmataceae bacterium]|nr:hypothetical protein [Gemmataceae bacterium]